MDEKTQDWLLEEIKRKHIALDISPTANSFEILKSCSKEFVSYVSKLLKDDFIIDFVGQFIEYGKLGL